MIRGFSIHKSKRMEGHFRYGPLEDQGQRFPIAWLKAEANAPFLQHAAMDFGQSRRAPHRPYRDLQSMPDLLIRLVKHRLGDDFAAKESGNGSAADDNQHEADEDLVRSEISRRKLVIFLL